MAYVPPESLLGTFLVGNLCNYALMGALAVQAYFYYITFPGDKFLVKALVFVVLAADITQTVISSHFVWHVLVSSWGDMIEAEARVWSLSALAPLNGSVAFIIQCFFAWRIWVLSGPRKVSVPVICVVTLTALTSCVLSFIFGISLGSPILGPVAQLGILGGWLGSSVICDVLITVTLVIQLLPKRSNDFKSANNALHRASRVALETGGLSSALAIASLILRFVGNNHDFFALIIISGNLYSNSFLASLNSRALFTSHDSQRQDRSKLEYEESRDVFRLGAPATSSSSKQGKITVCKVQTQHFDQ